MKLNLLLKRMNNAYKDKSPLHIHIHSQPDSSGWDAIVVSPFVSAAFSVSFSLARACFNEAETLFCNLIMASSALGQKHSSFNTTRWAPPFLERTKTGWDTPPKTFFSSKPISQFQTVL